MKFNTRKAGDTAFLAFSGKLSFTGFTGSQLFKIGEMVKREITNVHIMKVIFDLSNVIEVDSSASSFLIYIYKHIVHRNGVIVFVSPCDDDIRNKFYMLGLTKIFEFHGTPDKAMAAIRSKKYQLNHVPWFFENMPEKAPKMR